MGLKRIQCHWSCVLTVCLRDIFRQRDTLQLITRTVRPAPATQCPNFKGCDAPMGVTLVSFIISPADKAATHLSDVCVFASHADTHLGYNARSGVSHLHTRNVLSQAKLIYMFGALGRSFTLPGSSVGTVRLKLVLLFTTKFVKLSV